MDFKTLDNLANREIALKEYGQASIAILVICKLIAKFLDSQFLVLSGTFTGNDLDYLAPTCAKLNKQVIAIDPVYWISDEYRQDFYTYVENKHSSKTNVIFDWSDIEQSAVKTNFIFSCSGFGTRIDLLFRQQESCILINIRGNATDFYNLTKQDTDIYQVLRANSFDIYVKGSDLRDKVLTYLAEQTTYFSTLNSDFMFFRDFIAVVANRQSGQNNGYQQFIKYFNKDYKTISF
jgi:hypothetical protein